MESLSGREVRSWIPARRAEQSKRDFGRLLIAAGSAGMAGAAVLCGKAALRSGVGLATFYVPANLFSILQTALPEAMCADRYEQQSEKRFADMTAFAVGPGLGHHDEDVPVLRLILQQGKPVVLDADALNDIVRYDLHSIVKEAAGPKVLTPHEGEAARLLGVPVIDDRRQAAAALAEKYQAVVVLKGHGSLIASPDGRIAVNTTGNAAMAKGGSGDVLTGMIGAFLAKGMPAFEATCAGCYLHGAAGDLCRDRFGEESVLARDLTDAIPDAFIRLRSEEA